MTARMFLTGQRIMVPDPTSRTPDAVVEAVVIDSNRNTTHYRIDGETLKRWTYTARVKAAPVPEDMT